MAVINKPYEFLPNIVADASEVNRNFDVLYGEINGSLNSANIANNFSHPASQITINDTAGLITATGVEGALNELAGAISNETIVEMSEGLIGSVGDVSQAFAGHLLSLEEPGTTQAEVLALYMATAATQDAGEQDQAGNYNLTASNIAAGNVSITGSIFGGVLNAFEFDGTTNGFITQPTLLDNSATYDAGIAVDFWMKPADGHKAAYQTLFAKQNNTALDDAIYMNIQPTSISGAISWSTHVGGSSTTLNSITTFPNGTGTWAYVAANWDSGNGMRLWVNGVLEAEFSMTTTLNLMSGGAQGDFTLGCQNSGGGGAAEKSLPYEGMIANFRVRNKVLTQKDVNIGFATKITAPSIANDGNTEYDIRVNVQKEGNSEFEYQSELAEVCRNSSTIYAYGRQFNREDRRSIQATN